MRTLIPWLLGLLFPPSGKRRAPLTPLAAARAAPPPTLGAEPPHGEGIPWACPCVLAYRRAQARRPRRDRRTALVTVSAGIDYGELTA